MMFTLKEILLAPVNLVRFLHNKISDWLAGLAMGH
jgi:hypothetical protein